MLALLGVFAFATGCGGGEYEEPADIQEPVEQEPIGD
jgi:hypothetical protein